MGQTSVLCVGQTSFRVYPVDGGIAVPERKFFQNLVLHTVLSTRIGGHLLPLALGRRPDSSPGVRSEESMVCGTGCSCVGIPALRLWSDLEHLTLVL